MTQETIEMSITLLPRNDNKSTSVQIRILQRIVEKRLAQTAYRYARELRRYQMCV